jgi:hypothetical protein
LVSYEEAKGEASKLVRSLRDQLRKGSRSSRQSSGDLADWLLNQTPKLMEALKKADYQKRLRGIPSQDEEHEEFLVLMPDARNPERLSKTRELAAHTPMVQFFAHNQVEDGSQFPPFPDTSGVRNRLWFLDREDLRIKTKTSNSHRKVNVKRRSNGISRQPSGGGDGECFRWLTPAIGDYGQLGRVYPNLKKSTVSAKDPDRLLERLSARVFLDQGILRTAAITVDDPSDRFVISRTRSRSSVEPPIEQASATVVELTVEIEDQTVELCSSSIETGKPGRSLILRPDHRNRPVEIWIMNRELREVVRQLTHPPVRLGELREEEKEFRFFYDLLGNPPDQDDLPIAVELGRPSERGDFRPCDNSAMRRLYWPQLTGGESPNSGPCAPANAG